MLINAGVTPQSVHMPDSPEAMRSHSHPGSLQSSPFSAPPPWAVDPTQFPPNLMRSLGLFNPNYIPPPQQQGFYGPGPPAQYPMMGPPPIYHPPHPGGAFAHFFNPCWYMNALPPQMMSPSRSFYQQSPMREEQQQTVSIVEVVEGADENLAPQQLFRDVGSSPIPPPDTPEEPLENIDDSGITIPKGLTAGPATDLYRLIAAKSTRRMLYEDARTELSKVCRCDCE